MRVVGTGGLVKAASVPRADTRHVQLLVFTPVLQQPAAVEVEETAPAVCGGSGGCELHVEGPQTTTTTHTHGGPGLCCRMHRVNFENCLF